jgi:hypothetical protein
MLWDDLPARRSAAMRAWLGRQRGWLMVERLAACAPDLNPVDCLWPSLKAVEFIKPTYPTPVGVIERANLGTERIQQTPLRAYLPLRRTGLGLDRLVRTSTQPPRPLGPAPWTANLVIS